MSEAAHDGYYGWNDPEDTAESKVNSEESGPFPTDDLVRLYLNQINRTPLLTAMEEVDLAKRIEAGVYAGHILAARTAPIDESGQNTTHTDEDLELVARDGAAAKQHMLEANLRLVVSVAKRHIGRGVSFLDLIQEGNIGLVRGVEKFDYTKGYKFSTYATWWIRQAITRHIHDKSRLIHIPVHVSEQQNTIGKRRRDLSVELGREPTTQELARDMDMDGTKLEEILSYQDPISYNQGVADGGPGDTELHEFIEDDGALRPDEAVVGITRAEDVRGWLGALTARERLIVEMGTGMYDGTPYSYGAIAAKLAAIEGGKPVSRQRIRELDERAMRKLRSQNADHLKEYLTD